MKPLTPYQRLLDAVRKYREEIDGPETYILWTYPKNGIDARTRWGMIEFRERVIAAEQTNCDVRIREDNGNLVVEYVKRPADIDYDVS